MSWLQQCFNSLGRNSSSRTASAVTEPRPDQPDKVPTEKDRNNDQQQQPIPKKLTPLSRFEADY